MYPLYKDYYNFEKEKIIELSKRCIENKNIKTYNIKPNEIKKYLYKYKLEEKEIFVIIYDKWEDNLELNKLTDYFTQEERIRCNFKNNISPINYYINNKLEFKPKDIKEYNEFENYMFSKCKFCNNFRISICLNILEMFKPKKWLDISAGWGDRLLTALIYSNMNKEFKLYQAADPNPDLQKKYNQMIKSFNKTKRNFKIIQDGFEYIDIKDKDFDICLTSPPFFDMEEYSNDKHDSLTQYNTFQKWYDNFLMISVKKSIEHIKENGYLILYIELFDKIYNTKKMIDDITNNFNVEFKGSIYYIDDTNKNNLKPRPFFIWKKI